MPWEHEGGQGKYSYHPGGDTRNAPKDAPSAINVVVVPDVTLPKVNVVSASLQTGQLLAVVNLLSDFSFGSETADSIIAPPREVQQMGQGRILSFFTEKASRSGIMGLYGICR